MILPRLRDDVQLSAHAEGDEHFLVMHDVFGFADGPIMLHADMIEVLSACDGVTTTEELAEAAGVDPDGPEIRRVELFVRQIEEMGFLEGESADRLAESARIEWAARPTRPMACADATYPSEPKAFEEFCRDELGIVQRVGNAPYQAGNEDAPAVMALIPHIDFRVAPRVYGEAFNAIASSDADLVVMIGTSHYWSDHPVIVGSKPFETPLGILPVLPHDLGNEQADLAHKPEHSLELHAVALRYLWPDRDLAILPVLVTSDIFSEGALETWSDRIRSAVASSGRNPIWLISGDLAHVGPKFGDPLSSKDLLSEASKADAHLIEHLVAGDLGAYRRSIESLDNPYRVCGHAPTVLALTCKPPTGGRQLRYQVWDDVETESAVTFASVVWQ
ncbi:MAG: AmmeMemoRadiSam system protein B [Candidatus Kapabacteria bacterium]|nr:AmmeMemoRadiSam system protein B [Candidatus Kapabacteria bacterium]